MKTMKNLIRQALLVVAGLAMAFTLTSCSSNGSTNQKTDYKDANEVLTAIWNAEDADERPDAIGGMGDNLTDNEPAAVSLKDPEMVSQTFVVPVDMVMDSASASAIFNAIMINDFTASVYQLKDASKAKEYAKETAKMIEEQPWMCTFPDEYAVLSSDDYLIVVFGKTEQVSPFIEACKAVLPGSSELESSPLE